MNRNQRSAMRRQMMTSTLGRNVLAPESQTTNGKGRANFAPKPKARVHASEGAPRCATGVFPMAVSGRIDAQPQNTYVRPAAIRPMSAMCQTSDSTEWLPCVVLLVTELSEPRLVERVLACLRERLSTGALASGLVPLEHLSVPGCLTCHAWSSSRYDQWRR